VANHLVTLLNGDPQGVHVRDAIVDLLRRVRNAALVGDRAHQGELSISALPRFGVLRDARRAVEKRIPIQHFEVLLEPL
jgi:hypothetical protein